MEQTFKIVKLGENREKREIANTYRIDIECDATGAVHPTQFPNLDDIGLTTEEVERCVAGAAGEKLPVEQKNVENSWCSRIGLLICLILMTSSVSVWIMCRILEYGLTQIFEMVNEEFMKLEEDGGQMTKLLEHILKIMQN